MSLCPSSTLWWREGVPAGGAVPSPSSPGSKHRQQIQSEHWILDGYISARWIFLHVAFPQLPCAENIFSVWLQLHSRNTPFSSLQFKVSTTLCSCWYQQWLWTSLDLSEHKCFPTLLLQSLALLVANLRKIHQIVATLTNVIQRGLLSWLTLKFNEAQRRENQYFFSWKS